MQERSRALISHRGPLLTVLRPPSVAQATPSSCTSPSLNQSTVITAAAASNPGTGVNAGLAHVHLPTGSIRVSFGFMSTFEDVHALVSFLLTTFRDNKAATLVAEVLQDVEACKLMYC